MLFSLRNRLFVIFTILLTVPFILLSMIVPNSFAAIMETRTKDATVEMMEQYSLYINSITSQVEDLGKQALVNQNAQKWIALEERNAPQTDRLVMKNELKSELSAMMVNNSNGMSVAVYLNNGSGTAGNIASLQQVDWYRDFSLHDTRWLGAHEDTSEEIVNSYLLPLFNINSLDLSGVIKVNFPSSLLENALEKITLGEKGRAYLVNENGESVLPGEMTSPAAVIREGVARIQADNRKAGLMEVPYENEEYMLFYQRASVGNWMMLTEITKSELFQQIDDIQQKLLIASGWIFVLTIIASYLLSATITKPLGILTSSMKQVERGDFQKAKAILSADRKRKDEVGYAIDVFSQTTDRLNTLIETEYEANLRRRDAEYKALLLQINPHFLNNTLEIIGGLAAQGKNKEVIGVTTNLGRIMRYSLNTEASEVLLSEEMAYIKRFTNILQVRYEDSIYITIKEDPEAASLPIIKFVIQPLVENSVKYSLIDRNDVTLAIITEKEDDVVKIIVSDNGIGMSESLLEELRPEKLRNESNRILNSTGRSIGLRNVLARLQLYYGDRFTYEISSKEKEGTTIILKIRSLTTL